MGFRCHGSRRRLFASHGAWDASNLVGAWVLTRMVALLTQQDNLKDVVLFPSPQTFGGGRKG